jgi:hypothetical protein
MTHNPEQSERLLALAARVEAAEGPDRELDCRITCHLNGWDFRKIMHRNSDAYHNGFWAFRTSDGDKSTSMAPFFTKSLDVAMTLIPGQYRLGTLMEFDGDGRWAAKLFNRGKPGGLPAAGGASAALALCAAALRAHAHSKESTHD